MTSATQPEDLPASVVEEVGVVLGFGNAVTGATLTDAASYTDGLTYRLDGEAAAGYHRCGQAS